jgi:hypothetical protein
MTSDKPCKCGQPRHKGAKCKECYNTYMREYMERYRGTQGLHGRREYDLQRVYGIGLDEYEGMYNTQNGQCDICGTDMGESPHIDHDHACCDKKGSCGECVRGLLCNACNTGIARFRDDPDTLLKAITYLKKWGK